MNNNIKINQINQHNHNQYTSTSPIIYNNNL
jgi:hypothetical protein